MQITVNLAALFGKSVAIAHRAYLRTVGAATYLFASNGYSAIMARTRPSRGDTPPAAMEARGLSLPSYLLTITGDSAVGLRGDSLSFAVKGGVGVTEPALPYSGPDIGAAIDRALKTPAVFRGYYDMALVHDTARALGLRYAEVAVHRQDGFEAMVLAPEYSERDEFPQRLGVLMSRRSMAPGAAERVYSLPEGVAFPTGEPQPAPEAEPGPAPDPERDARRERAAALERFASGIAWAFKQGPEGRTAAKLDLPEDLAASFDGVMAALSTSQRFHHELRTVKNDAEAIARRVGQATAFLAEGAPGGCEVRGPKETVSDAILHPLIAKIAEVCLAHRINFITCFELDPSPSGEPIFVTSCQLTPGVHPALVKAAYGLVPELDAASEMQAELREQGRPLTEPLDLTRRDDTRHDA